jgi:hypothetical protein
MTMSMSNELQLSQLSQLPQDVVLPLRSDDHGHNHHVGHGHGHAHDHHHGGHTTMGVGVMSGSLLSAMAGNGHHSPYHSHAHSQHDHDGGHTHMRTLPSLSLPSDSLGASDKTHLVDPSDVGSLTDNSHNHNHGHGHGPGHSGSNDGSIGNVNGSHKRKRILRGGMDDDVEVRVSGGTIVSAHEALHVALGPPPLSLPSIPSMSSISMQSLQYGQPLPPHGHSHAHMPNMPPMMHHPHMLMYPPQYHMMPPQYVPSEYHQSPLVCRLDSLPSASWLISHLMFVR